MTGARPPEAGILASAAAIVAAGVELGTKEGFVPSQSTD
jgi:hypothetical protein